MTIEMIRDVAGDEIEVHLTDRERLALALSLLNEIVVPDGPDAGLIIKDQESPFVYSPALGYHVYQLVYFSELGAALVHLHWVLSGNLKGADDGKSDD